MLTFSAFCPRHCLFYPSYSHTSSFHFLGVLNHNGALSTDLISSEFTSLQKSAQLIKASFQNGILICIARFIVYSAPSDKTLSKPIGLRLCQVVVFACRITLLNQDILKP